MNDNLSSPAQNDLNCLCHEKLPILVLQGLQLFNKGDYFEAHELLEIAWRSEKRPIRELYRDILQVGVGFYHIKRENFTGAHNLFQRALTWLEPFPVLCQGMDVGFIRRQTIRVDDFLCSSFPNPSRLTLERLFFTIPIPNQEQLENSDE